MHCLRAYITRAGVLDMKDIPHAMHEGFLIIPMGEKFFALLGNPKVLQTALVEKLKTFAEIQTDYFGGFGEQTAKLWINGVEEYISSPDSPINEALKKMGLTKLGDLDEFDTINLCAYRTESDIVEEWDKANGKESKDKSGLEIERRFLLKGLPQVIKDRIFAGMRGLKIGQVYVETEGKRLRLRRTFDPTSGTSTYYETIKTPVSHGTCQEDERVISEEEYTKGLANAKRNIHKTRYEIADEQSGLKWEIDDFGSMIIAEIELPTIDHHIDIPDSIREVTVMEVTGMDQFSNYKLANNI